MPGRLALALLVTAACSAAPDPAPAAPPAPVDAGPARAPAPADDAAAHVDRSTCPKAAQPAAALRSIRDVDWCNRAYVPGWLTLVEGESEMHEWMDGAAGHDTHIAELADVAYGDIDGDGADEAAVLLHLESYTGGNHMIGADLFLFALRDGSVVDLGSAPASRVKAWELAIEHGGVAMRYRRDGRNCTDRWRLQGGALKLVATLCPP